jgi:hypothetical protein
MLSRRKKKKNKLRDVTTRSNATMVGRVWDGRKTCGMITFSRTRCRARTRRVRVLSKIWRTSPERAINVPVCKCAFFITRAIRGRCKSKLSALSKRSRRGSGFFKSFWFLSNAFVPTTERGQMLHIYCATHVFGAVACFDRKFKNSSQLKTPKTSGR